MHQGKCIICSYAQASCAHLHVHHTLCTTTWALKCVSLHYCTKYRLFIDIQSYVSLVHSSFDLKLFMWANIFWNCGIYPSLQVILITIHKQLRATAPCDLAILYYFYGQITLDFWWWNLWSILASLLLFKIKSRILVNKFSEYLFTSLPFFIEISFGNHPCQLGFFLPNLKALLASNQINQLS
jgi:hypothetical protein